MSYNVNRALIEARQRNSVSSPAQTAIGTTAAQVLAANGNRKGLIIQNTGTTTLYFCYGTSTPTTTVYHMALKACSGADDGSGGVFIDDAWTGAITMLSSGASGTCVITEIGGAP